MNSVYLCDDRIYILFINPKSICSCFDLKSVKLLLKQLRNYDG